MKKEQGGKDERMKTELITNVSHDLKTPLTSIINYVDLLKKEEPAIIMADGRRLSRNMRSEDIIFSNIRCGCKR